MDPNKLSFIYGTAWKREQTCELVSKALLHGFTGFDTAGQPKHYREDLVGQAIRDAFAQCVIANRADIYVWSFRFLM
jgi:diketogulonate reductase-like aldo/keto reductase